ncbi:Het-C domain-containing protein [Pseudomonas entomophila]|uniref:Het-C domain-containing protein n=1 Tax=Pseudomonas entomophila TaxID=312306 RepID=UPI00200DD4E3|nr:Het-C domain-containing protein [Pseudomonas entomophila]
MSDLNVGTPTLRTTFAQDQLRNVANNTTELEFLLMFMPIFGFGIPPTIFVQLRNALLDGDLVELDHEVIDSEELVAFDAQAQVARVSRAAIEGALLDPQTSPELLMALLCAFGQYLGDRFQVAIDALETGDAPKPELNPPEEIGQKYLAMMGLFDDSVQTGTVFAHYTDAEHDVDLVLDVSHAPEFEDGGEPFFIEPRFAAGSGHGQGSDGHESIEQALASVGFSAKERKAIYFGNWLRDHAQLIDPKIVLPAGEPAQFPKKISRQALTEVVGLLATREFSSLQQTPEDRDAYRVTTQMLGVYRSMEHIDNPVTFEENPIDPFEIDEDFVSPVLPGDEETKANPTTLRKQYIDQSIMYMRHKLFRAAAAGKTAEGMRYFGEALHVLEDYFAHSNFVELSLRKNGFEDVLAWTCAIESAEGEHVFPIVTGMFSGLDIIASVAEPIARVLFPAKRPIFEPLKPGYRSDSEKMLLILLKEQANQDWYNAMERFLARRDRIAGNPFLRFVRLYNWATALPRKLVTQYSDKVYQLFLIKLGDSIKDLQTAFETDPNIDPNAEPTHSQLAKDHDTHPLHELAVWCAKYAVGQVGEKMHRLWHMEPGEMSDEKVAELAKLAEEFIRHPNHTEWQDDLVQAWAALEGSASKIKQATRTSFFHDIRDHYVAEGNKWLARLKDENAAPAIPLSESFRVDYPF